MPRAVCARLRIQTFVPSLFQHSLIKLYTEGDLTSSKFRGEMAAQNITKVPKRTNGYHKKPTIKIAPTIAATSRGEPQ
jgi:hypothetical protein